MEKKSHSVKCGPKAMRQRATEPTQGPSKAKVTSPVDHGNDDVAPPPPPPPPHFYVNLCFPNEDLAEIRRNYKGLRPPVVTSEDYFEKLGFVNGFNTLMYVSDKKRVSKDINKMEKCHRSDDDELKGYLSDFVEQAKAAKVLARMSRKTEKTVQKQVISTSAPRHGKAKFVPKKLTLEDILAAVDQEWHLKPLF